MSVLTECSAAALISFRYPSMIFTLALPLLNDLNLAAEEVTRILLTNINSVELRGKNDYTFYNRILLFSINSIFF